MNGIITCIVCFVYNLLLIKAHRSTSLNQNLIFTYLLYCARYLNSILGVAPLCTETYFVLLRLTVVYFAHLLRPALRYLCDASPRAVQRHIVVVLYSHLAWLWREGRLGATRRK